MTTNRVYRMTPPGTAVVDIPSKGDPRPLRHVPYHSQGFSWGYGGSGPADLALSILCDHFGELRHQTPVWYGTRAHWLARVEKTKAWPLHQRFKWEIVANRPQHRPWTLTHDQIVEWLRTLMRERAERGVPVP